MTIKHARALRVLALTVLAACADRETTIGVRASAVISDEAHNGGTAGFWFLPPLARPPSVSGVFDPGLSVVVSVNRLGASGVVLETVAEFSSAGGGGSETILFAAVAQVPHNLYLYGLVLSRGPRAMGQFQN